MRIRTILIVALLGVAFSGAAFGQQAAASVAPKATSGINFAFDAPQGQLTASGYTLKPTPNASSSTIHVSGTVEVTLTINLVTKFHRRVFFPCSAMVVGAEVDVTNFVVDGGLETVSGWATVSSSNPSTATCTLTIPFEWTFEADPAAISGLLIAYATAGVTPEGRTVRSTLQVTGLQEIHPGTTMKNDFTVTL
jgi:hypothetical protein